MTVAISLSPEAERRLTSQAERQGIDLPTLASRVLEAEAGRLAGSNQSKRNQATLDLLAQWEREEQTSDPAEIARREREVTEFIEGINRDRTECEGRGARKIIR